MASDDRYDAALKALHLQQLGHRGDLVRLRLGSDLAEDSRCSQPQAETIRNADLPLAFERATEHLADHALAGLRKAGHEALKAVAELFRVEGAEQPA